MECGKFRRNLLDVLSSYSLRQIPMGTIRPRSAARGTVCERDSLPVLSAGGISAPCFDTEESSLPVVLFPRNSLAWSLRAYLRIALLWNDASTRFPAELLNTNFYPPETVRRVVGIVWQVSCVLKDGKLSASFGRTRDSAAALKKVLEHLTRLLSG